MMHLPDQQFFCAMQGGTRIGDFSFVESGCVTVKLNRAKDRNVGGPAHIKLRQRS